MIDDFKWLMGDETSMLTFWSVFCIYSLDYWTVFQPHLDSQAQPVDARSQPHFPVVALSQY